MRFFLFFFLVVVLAASPAAAQDLLRDHRLEDPTAFLLDPDHATPKTQADFANLYYQSCFTSNEDPVLNEYVATQCACTSVKMMEFMSLRDMEALFTKTKEGDFQQVRVLMLAYGPCMYDSVYDFVYDGCLYGQKPGQQKMRHPRKVCECYAHKMGNHVASIGYRLIPGLDNGSFDREKAVPNPFVHLLEGYNFTYVSDIEYKRCVMNEEYFPSKKRDAQQKPFRGSLQE